MEEGEGELNLKQKNMNMSMSSSRKEKRKAIKKMKRKQMRKETAERERQEEEAVLNDPEEQHRLHLLELEEAQRMERERNEFLQRERAYQEQQLLLEKEKQKEKEKKLLLQQSQSQSEEEEAKENNDDNEEEEEELLPEIIWQGNEIIFKKKKKLRVPDRQHKTLNYNEQPLQDAADTRPSSNPLPPESHILENVALQVPNFGTEQDKSHCPFHLKTGACRFGQRCSRVHFYPDKSCTLLIKNMYNGPGLAWEQDEGLEYTDEEIECCYEEFYEDVHTEFLKFGEIVNFKVCKNGSFHLRGNVYVQYKLLDSALLAYNSVNGRYFAGKQISCTFVNLTRWKVAICGEYMKSGFKTCSHGTACNFIHCFRNPGGDYEWADSDKPPPKYWLEKMAALFGYCDDHESSRERENLSVRKNSSKMSKADSDSYHSRRSRSREMDQLNSGRSDRRKNEDERKQISPDEEHKGHLQDNCKRKRRTPDIDSEGEWLEKEENREKHHKHYRKSSLNRNYSDNSRSHEEGFDMGLATITRDTEKQHGRKERNLRKWSRDNKDWIYEAESEGYVDRKRHHVSKRKSSRHQSRDNGDVTIEAESDKDLFDRGYMETHDYSRKSLRHRRSGLQDDDKYHDNENEEVDGGLFLRESSRQVHHHKKMSSKHQKKLDSIVGDTNNACRESNGE